VVLQFFTLRVLVEEQKSNRFYQRFFFTGLLPTHVCLHWFSSTIWTEFVFFFPFRSLCQDLFALQWAEGGQEEDTREEENIESGE